MKIWIVLLFIVLLVAIIFSCSSNAIKITHHRKIERSVASVPDNKEYDLIDTNFDLVDKIAKFQDLIKETFVWRKRAILLFEKIEKEDGDPKKYLEEFQQVGIDYYKKLRDAYYIIIDEYRWIVAADVEIRIINNEKTNYVESEIQDNGYFDKSIDREKEIVLKINRNDLAGQNYIKNIKMSLAAALTLYDNYIFVIQKYKRLKKRGRIDGWENQEYPHYLKEISDELNDLNNFDQVAKAILFFKNQREWEENSKNPLDRESKYLNDLIEQSYFYGQNKESGYFLLFFTQFDTLGEIVRDKLLRISSEEHYDKIDWSK